MCVYVCVCMGLYACVSMYVCMCVYVGLYVCVRSTLSSAATVPIRSDLNSVGISDRMRAMAAATLGSVRSVIILEVFNASLGL
jgi:hypothetical protein